MQEHNPYVCAQMHNIQQEEENHERELSCEPQIVRLFLKHCRRYNEPTHNEVAVVFVGDDEALPANRGHCSIPKNRGPQRISYMSCHADPMCYPILFQRGNLGWHNAKQLVEKHRIATRNRLTMQQFYGLCATILVSSIHSSGKLFQLYLLYAYVKTEGCRLFFIHNNQAQLRVDLYSCK